MPREETVATVYRNGEQTMDRDSSSPHTLSRSAGPGRQNRALSRGTRDRTRFGGFGLSVTIPCPENAVSSIREKS